MTIVFSNQKGGVGKSTLCVSLANYWASQGLQVHVYDVDVQKTLTIARAEELKNEPDRHPLFEITSMEIVTFCKQIESISKEPGLVLIDLPGSFGKETIQILQSVDLVIVPFQYENYCLDATGRFGTQLDVILERSPIAHFKSVYVPNRINTNIGRKSDKAYWKMWEDAIRASALLSPIIPERACMQRRSTLYINPEERQCLSPCFEYIDNLIWGVPPQETEKIEGKEDEAPAPNTE